MITNAVPDQASKHTGAEKAAVLLVTLGEQVGAEVLKHLDEDEVATIGKEIARTQNITAEDAESILNEFYHLSMAQDYVLKGGIDYARKMLVTAFGAEAAKKMLTAWSKCWVTTRPASTRSRRRTPATREIHPQRTSADDCARIEPSCPSQAAGLLFSLLSSYAPTWCSAWPTRPDLAGDYFEDRQYHRSKTEIVRRVEL